jgi:hypothetical protein
MLTTSALHVMIAAEATGEASRREVRVRRPIELGSSPGFEMADDAKAIRARVYAPSAGTCTVLVSWPPYAKPSDADLERYLDSFKTTK